MTKEELEKEFNIWKTEHFGDGKEIATPDEFNCVLHEFMIPKLKDILKELIGEDIKFVIGQKETYYERGYNKKYQEIIDKIKELGYD